MTTDLFANTCEYLKRLKLATIRENLDDHLRLAQAKSLSHLEFFHGLTQEEIRGREASNLRKRSKAARFPTEKRLNDFDFAFQPSVSRGAFMALKSCRWLANAENVILAGQAGTGKSHLAIALGYEAIELGYNALFMSLAELMEKVNEGMACGGIPALKRRLIKQDVIILDEVGYLKVNRDQGHFLFWLVSQAYEKQSLIITTNKDFSAWTEIFEDPVLVTAMLDRLLHHSHIFAIKGESYRIKNRLTPSKKGREKS